MHTAACCRTVGLRQAKNKSWVIGPAFILQYVIAETLTRFRKIGMLRNGVPSEATLCRVEQGIDELSMAVRMRVFAEAYHARLPKDKAGMDIICVDGKALRGTVLADGSSPDIASAYSPSTGITLATEACQEKSNEIKAVPRLIDKYGRIETRTYRIHDGLDMIADREKWGGGMTVVEYESDTVIKSTGARSTERRLYVTSLAADTPLLGALVRTHWSIESMHWGLDVNLQQDRIRRRSSRSARNLDTIQRIVYSMFSIWKRLHEKRADRRKGMAEIMRHVSANFTKLISFLCQK